VLAGCTGHGLGLFVELAHLVAAAIDVDESAALAPFDPHRARHSDRR
jgi:hypothetical protein